MNVLVTGSKGFIGKHMCLALKRANHIVFEYDIDSTVEQLKDYIKQSEFIINLAGVNRPLTTEEFYDGNANFVVKLIELVKELNPKATIIANSSIQAELDNDYGKSKKLAEDYLLSSGLKVYIYRFSNVFGKWCRPNYNSASATFSYNIAHNLPIQIRDRNYVVHYNYVDDICDEFVKLIEGKIDVKPNCINYFKPVYDCSLGKLADLLYCFKECVESDKHLPILHDEFEVKLFIQFLDYLSDEGYTYNYAVDARGSFEELYKSKKYGQIGLNIAYPNQTKGNHYHTRKDEVFYTVSGNNVVYIRKHGETAVKEYDSSDAPFVKIDKECLHSIINVGNDNSVTLMWISEIYNPNDTDTFAEEVIKNE